MTDAPTRLYDLWVDGTPLCEAWIDYASEPLREQLEQAKRANDKGSLILVKEHRDKLLTALRQKHVAAVGHAERTGLAHDKTLVPIFLCREEYVNWKDNIISDEVRRFSAVMILFDVTSELVYGRRSGAAVGQKHERLVQKSSWAEELAALRPGARMLIEYIVSNEDWDGFFRPGVVDELNDNLIARYGHAPHFSRSVDRKTWSNHKKTVWKILENSGKTLPSAWK